MDVQQVLVGTQETLNARRVFGEPIQVNGMTVIPAATVRGGGGGGGKSSEEGGVGFGINARPAGAFVVNGREVTWRPAIDVNRIVLGGQLVAMTALVFAVPALIRRWRRP